jgi:uncharacterized protein YcbX
MSARVAWISLAPVKATALHLVDEVDVLETGLRDDRRFYFVGEAGRLLNNKDCGPLQLVQASYDERDDVLELRLPDGAVVGGPVERGEELETRFHSRARGARVVHGPWAEAVSSVVGERVRLVEPRDGAADRGREGAATLLGTASLGALGAVLGVDQVDGRRFRMNFGIDGLEPHAEDEWLGRRVAVGEAVVVPSGNVGRCVVTTQSPETGRTDLPTLKALAAYRGDLETTEPLPFGVHAAVVEPGRVRLGDPVETL